MGSRSHVHGSNSQAKVVTGSIPEQDRLARSQTKVLFLVLLSEVVFFYIHHSRERHLVGCILAGEWKYLQKRHALLGMQIFIMNVLPKVSVGCSSQDHSTCQLMAKWIHAGGGYIVREAGRGCCLHTAGCQQGVCMPCYMSLLSPCLFVNVTDKSGYARK